MDQRGVAFVSELWYWGSMPDIISLSFKDSYGDGDSSDF